MDCAGDVPAEKMWARRGGYDAGSLLLTPPLPHPLRQQKTPVGCRKLE
jgi:hypothetical protein